MHTVICLANSHESSPPPYVSGSLFENITNQYRPVDYVKEPHEYLLTNVEFGHISHEFVIIITPISPSSYKLNSIDYNSEEDIDTNNNPYPLHLIHSIQSMKLYDLCLLGRLNVKDRYAFPRKHYLTSSSDYIEQLQIIIIPTTFDIGVTITVSCHEYHIHFTDPFGINEIFYKSLTPLFIIGR